MLCKWPGNKSLFLFMLFDTHTHLNFKAFEESYREVIQESLARGVLLTNVGSQYETSLRAVEIAREFADDPVFATVGLHPVHVGTGKNAQEFDVDEVRARHGTPIEGSSSAIHEFEYEKYKALGQDSKVIAIGECGIDYFRLPHEENDRREVVEKQGEVFKAHIRLASELKKPLMIHCRPSKDDPRDAYRKMIEILSSFVGDVQRGGRPAFADVPLRGVVHCFIGDIETARGFLKLGFSISFTGIITFKVGARRGTPLLADVVREVPMERILIETDAPYLAPEPFRGKTNYPYYVEYVARKIAEIKGVSYEEVAKVTTQNAKKLFGV
ncbi:MAG: Hydrolase, TatD family [Parcubacteria group bacterium GW2011_GWA2_44_12]|nr:MAG: Hydrolase, TatD family [Parcubacteria group bacterium GW2011_GWA2_44_12]